MMRLHRFCAGRVFSGAVLPRLMLMLRLPKLPILVLVPLLSILLLVPMLLLPEPVAAQTDTFIPYVSVKQEYSDNIVFTRDNEEDDFITTGNAGMVYTHRDARVRALVDARLSRLVYWDNDQLDSTDGLVRGSWKYQVTERAGAGLAASFRNASRRDQDLDATGVVLSGDRDRADVSGSADYRFSEITTGEITVGYTSTQVDGNPQFDGTNRDEDYDTVQVDLAFTRNMSRIFKNTTGLLNVSYMRYASELDTTRTGTRSILFFNIPVLQTNFQEFDSDVFQVTAGFSRDITELYNVYLMGGASYTDTTESVRTVEKSVQTGQVILDRTLPDQDDDNLGGVLAAGVNYGGLYWDVSLGVSHDVRGSSGTNGTVERTAVTLDVDRKVSEDFFLTFNASGFLNRNDRTTIRDLDEFTINIQPGFRYKITDTWTLSGVYRYTSVDDRELENNSTRERNLVYLLVRKDFEL